MTEINEVAERVAARRAELDEEEKLLAERFDAVRAEREERAVAMRVWERMHAQLDAEKPSTQAETAQVGGRGVLLVPHRKAGAGEDILPPDYQRLMKIVRDAGGPVRIKDVGVELDLVQPAPSSPRGRGGVGCGGCSGESEGAYEPPPARPEGSAAALMPRTVSR